MATVFRAVAGASPGEVKYPRPNSRRVPKHIPYLVDNLWEWARPKGFANRRQCSYGSHSVEDARKFGSGEVYKVEFLGSHQVCQLQGYDDAKLHPDVQGVKKAAFELLGGYDWSNQDLPEKVGCGRLYIPGLTGEEVEQVLGECGISEGGRKTLQESVTFWDDVALVQVEESFPDDRGEIFFTYPDGYSLQPV